ncbi:hypothetical protein BDW75DRAFT_225084 [Aspergillus navahoensis]
MALDLVAAILKTAPAEPPAFRGDYTARALSSPSISSSNNSIEEFLRLPDAQDNIY